MWTGYYLHEAKLLAFSEGLMGMKLSAWLHTGCTSEATANYVARGGMGTRQRTRGLASACGWGRYIRWALIGVSNAHARAF